MLNYLARRAVYMLIMLWILTMVIFFIIQLPAGDYVTTLAAQLAQRGEDVNEELLSNLRRRYGLDQPLYAQYLKWLGNALQGDFGYSFQFQRPVAEIIGERLALTVAISIFTLTFTYVMAIPIGIYSATRQYSIGDYFFMSVGFIGLATPNFLLALILMLAFFSLGISVGGLFSPEFNQAAWSLARVLAFGGDGNKAVQAVGKCMKVAPDGHPMGTIVVVGNPTFEYRNHEAGMTNIDIRRASRVGPGYHDDAWERGADYPPVFMRWTTRTNLDLTVRLIGEQKLQVSALTTHTIRMDRAEQDTPALLDDPDRVLGVVFTS